MANQGPREVSSGSFYSNKSMSKSKRPHTRKPFGISNRSTSAVTDVPQSLTQQRVSTSHNLSGTTHSSLPREYMSLGSINNDLEYHYNGDNSTSCEEGFDFGSDFGDDASRTIVAPPIQESHVHHGQDASQSAASTSNIVVILQQQQAILQEVLDGQKALEARQTNVEDKIIHLQSQVEKSTSSSNSPSSSDGKEKSIVTRALSVCYCDVISTIIMPYFRIRCIVLQEIGESVQRI